MTDLCGLPDELLLAIANCLRGGTNNGYSDLKHLALCCRKLRPIAQECLYTEVTIMKRRPVQGLTSIARLAGTLLQRPDLANRVRKLHIKTSDGPATHSKNCAHRMHCLDATCICGLDELFDRCTSFLGSAKARNGLSLHNEAWMSMLYQRREVAISALILCLTSALTTLTLTSCTVPRMDFEQPDNAQHIALEAMFRSLNSSVDHIDGLSNLTRLSTDGLPPSSWLRLPRLKALKLSMFGDDDEEAQASIIRSYASPSAFFSTTITRLAIQTGFEAFCSNEINDADGIYGPMSNIISGLTSLTHLFILFCSTSDTYYDFPPPYAVPQGSYAHIASKLESRSLTHLTLDVDELPDEIIYAREIFKSVLEHIHGLASITSFTGLPNLRHICAPQEAFFSADEDFETCDLPATIESIGIIESTYETKRYIKHVLNRQNQWPNLKLIKLGEGTYDHLYKSPDESEDEEGSESEDDDWRQLFEVDDSIYEDAKGSGVRVKKIRDGSAWNRGWDGLGLQRKNMEIAEMSYSDN